MRHGTFPGVQPTRQRHFWKGVRHGTTPLCMGTADRGQEALSLPGVHVRCPPDDVAPVVLRASQALSHVRKEVANSTPQAGPQTRAVQDEASPTLPAGPLTQSSSAHGWLGAESSQKHTNTHHQETPDPSLEPVLEMKEKSSIGRECLTLSWAWSEELRRRPHTGNPAVLRDHSEPVPMSQRPTQLGQGHQPGARLIRGGWPLASPGRRRQPLRRTQRSINPQTGTGQSALVCSSSVSHPKLSFRPHRVGWEGGALVVPGTAHRQAGKETRV